MSWPGKLYSGLTFLKIATFDFRHVIRHPLDPPAATLNKCGGAVKYMQYIRAKAWKVNLVISLRGGAKALLSPEAEHSQIIDIRQKSATQDRDQSRPVKVDKNGDGNQ